MTELSITLEDFDNFIELNNLIDVTYYQSVNIEKFIELMKMIKSELLINNSLKDIINFTATKGVSAFSLNISGKYFNHIYFKPDSSEDFFIAFDNYFNSTDNKYLIDRGFTISKDRLPLDLNSFNSMLKNLVEISDIFDFENLISKVKEAGLYNKYNTIQLENSLFNFGFYSNRFVLTDKSNLMKFQYYESNISFFIGDKDFQISKNDLKDYSLEQIKKKIIDTTNNSKSTLIADIYELKQFLKINEIVSY